MRFKFVFIKIIIVFFITSVSGPALILADTLKMGYIEFPPAFSTNASGKPEGAIIDLAEKVLTKAGYEFKMKSYSINRMVETLINGEIDLWIGLPTLPQFKGTTLVGKSEILKIRLMAYTIGKKTPIKSRDNLKGKSLIIMRGFSYGGWIKDIKDPANNIKFTETDEHDLGFKMLKAGRGDYLLNYRLPSELVLKNMTIPDLNSNEISSFGAYFVVSRKSRDAQEILDNLEKAYRDLSIKNNAG